MAKKLDLDLTGLELVKSTASQLVADYSALRKEQLDCENAYFMVDNQMPSGISKPVISPDAHNKVRGSARLLSATEPAFNLPAAKNLKANGINSSDFELAANAMWAASNLVQEINVEHDMAHSGTLYGEMHLAIVSTKDMLDGAQRAVSENKDKDRKPLLDAALKHAQSVNKRTPFIFPPLDSNTCYARKSRVGLEAHYQKVEMTVADAIVQYGADALRVVKARKSFELITLHIFFDRANTYVWIDGEAEPLVAGPNGLSFIPRAYYVPEGSTVYKKPEQQIIPFLYPVIKSGIWNKQNLFLSVTAAAAAAMMNSQFVMEQGSDGATVELDLKTMGGIVYVPQGSKLYPLAKDIINPQLVAQYQLYDQLVNESTIYDQTLGQPLAGGPTFSEVALMHQAGRLPLSPIQKGMAALFANAMSIAFQWMKDVGKSTIQGKDGQNIEIDPTKITDSLNFEAQVEVKMPTDSQQGAQTAVAVNQAGLASKEWQRENLLSINQSDVEQKKIWKEQMADAMTQTLLPQFIEMLAQKMGLSTTMPTEINSGGGTTPAAATGPTGEIQNAEPTTPIASPGGPNPAGQ